MAGQWVFVPEGHACYVYPIPADDDNPNIERGTE